MPRSTPAPAGTRTPPAAPPAATSCAPAATSSAAPSPFPGGAARRAQQGTRNPGAPAAAARPARPCGHRQRRRAATPAQYFTDLRILTCLITASWPAARGLAAPWQATLISPHADAARRQASAPAEGRAQHRQIAYCDTPPLEAGACAALLTLAADVLASTSPRSLTRPSGTSPARPSRPSGGGPGGSWPETATAPRRCAQPPDPPSAPGTSSRRPPPQPTPAGSTRRLGRNPATASPTSPPTCPPHGTRSTSPRWPAWHPGSCCAAPPPYASPAPAPRPATRSWASSSASRPAQPRAPSRPSTVASKPPGSKPRSRPRSTPSPGCSTPRPPAPTTAAAGKPSAAG